MHPPGTYGYLFDGMSSEKLGALGMSPAIVEAARAREQARGVLQYESIIATPGGGPPLCTFHRQQREAGGGNVGAVRQPLWNARPVVPTTPLSKDAADAKLGDYIVARARGVEDTKAYRDSMVQKFESTGFPTHAFVVRNIDRLCSALPYAANIGSSV